MWRYLLRRDDDAPAPWTKEGKKRIEEGGWGEMQYPENYHEAKRFITRSRKWQRKLPS